jgi:hypothetical protein
MIKQKKSMGKKGEITTTQLVMLIVLITSFVVILFLVFRLNLGETSNNEICRNSVVLRGQSKLATGPLDCQTNYVCISGGGDCAGITASKKIKLNSVDDDSVLRVLANEMSSCWYVFGEGKIDYGGGATEHGVNYAVCDIVAFDSKIQEEVESITYLRLYGYLRSNSKTTSQTYLQYLYETNSRQGIDTEPLVKFDIDEDVIDTSKTYSILTGVDKNVLDVLDDDRILKVYIIPTDETSSRLAEDREFLTTA